MSMQEKLEQKTKQLLGSKDQSQQLQAPTIPSDPSEEYHAELRKKAQLYDEYIQKVDQLVENSQATALLKQIVKYANTSKRYRDHRVNLAHKLGIIPIEPHWPGAKFLYPLEFGDVCRGAILNVHSRLDVHEESRLREERYKGDASERLWRLDALKAYWYGHAIENGEFGDWNATVLWQVYQGRVSYSGSYDRGGHMIGGGAGPSFKEEGFRLCVKPDCMRLFSITPDDPFEKKYRLITSAESVNLEKFQDILSDAFIGKF